MITEETERAVKRELRYLFGGHGLIVVIVLVGVAMLAGDIHWTWTLIMIPVSAEGALMLFEARASKHSRVVEERLQTLEQGQAVLLSELKTVGELVGPLVDRVIRAERRIENLAVSIAGIEGKTEQCARNRQSLTDKTLGKLTHRVEANEAAVVQLGETVAPTVRVTSALWDKQEKTDATVRGIAARQEALVAEVPVMVKREAEQQYAKGFVDGAVENEADQNGHILRFPHRTDEKRTLDPS